MRRAWEPLRPVFTYENDVSMSSCSRLGRDRCSVYTRIVTPVSCCSPCYSKSVMQPLCTKMYVLHTGTSVITKPVGMTLSTASYTMYYMLWSLIATMQCVVTGQAPTPISLEWKITSGRKQVKTEDNKHNNWNKSYTGWFRLNAKNCVPGNSSRRFFELDHEISVSYTHLTLPTICSV